MSRNHPSFLFTSNGELGLGEALHLDRLDAVNKAEGMAFCHQVVFGSDVSNGVCREDLRQV